MAEKYKVSVAQLCIRYVLQLGTAALPKTGNPVHMKDNADVDFQISKDDMNKLVKVKPIKYGIYKFMPVFNGK